MADEPIWPPVGGGAGVTTFNTRSGAVLLTKADVTGTGLAAADVAAVAAAARGAANGVASLDAGSQVPLAQLGNAPGGGGAVTSVNTHTGAVVLTASDVSAVGLGAGVFGTWHVVKDIGVHVLSPIVSSGTTFVLGSTVIGTVPAALNFGNSAFGGFRFDPADWPAGPAGATPKVSVRVAMLNGSSAQTATITVSLFPVATLGGTSQPTIATVGAAIATASVVNAAAGSQLAVSGASANAPAAGIYILGLTATSAVVQGPTIGAVLQIQQL